MNVEEVIAMAGAAVESIIQNMDWPRKGASFEWHLIDKPHEFNGPISIRFFSPRFCIHDNLENLTAEVQKLVESQLERAESMLAGEAVCKVETCISVNNTRDSGPNVYGDRPVLFFYVIVRS